MLVYKSFKYLLFKELISCILYMIFLNYGLNNWFW